MKFNKRERSGVFFLLLIIFIFQCAYFFFKMVPSEEVGGTFSEDADLQIRIDSLKRNQHGKDRFRIYPFNPNFITDYKGYALGMSALEIDRLHAFRSKEQYVNSPEEFQEVTLVSDSLLATISPYFKFPAWTRKTGMQSTVSNSRVHVSKSDMNNRVVKIKDLNQATAEELKIVKGIGDKLSARIVKFRDRLGGFLIDEQLYDVYGLDPEVVDSVYTRFKVLRTPTVQKININTASAREISQLIYITYEVARRIVEHRENVGSIGSFDELTKIADFPSDKIDRIKLYLTL
ncbi:MAG: helix-hairpin-helix domain-containing protein [Saonia sp.]